MKLFSATNFLFLNSGSYGQGGVDWSTIEFAVDPSEPSFIPPHDYFASENSVTSFRSTLSTPNRTNNETYFFRNFKKSLITF